MKKSEVILILSCLVGTCIFLYVCIQAQKTDIDKAAIKKAVKQQQQKDKVETEKYKSMYDSVVTENKADRKAISLINNAIKNLIHENDQNKTRAITANDSTKNFIADSLLQSGGYR